LTGGEESADHLCLLSLPPPLLLRNDANLGSICLVLDDDAARVPVTPAATCRGMSSNLS
jgi:hypothetical protein